MHELSLPTSPTSAPPLSTVDGSLVEWATAADEGDHLDLALALFAAVPDDEAGGDGRVVARARLLLLLERPQDALALLRATARPSSPLQGPPPGGTSSWPRAWPRPVMPTPTDAC